MSTDLNRRDFIGVAGTAALTGTLASTVAGGAASTAHPMKILGIACSPRRGMTTAKAVQIALDAARAADPRLATELIDLGGLNITGFAPTPPVDDFTPILPKLQDPAVAGLIIGSPAYYRGMSSLCKAFIERCGPLREPKMLLQDKPVGVIALGGFRNGGHELVIEQIQVAMLCFGMIPVGGRAPGFQGATLVPKDDDISGDEAGLTTTRNIGIRVAEMAVRLAGKPA